MTYNIQLPKYSDIKDFNYKINSVIKLQIEPVLNTLNINSIATNSLVKTLSATIELLGQKIKILEEKDERKCSESSQTLQGTNK